MKDLKWVCHKAKSDSCELAHCWHDSEFHSFLRPFLRLLFCNFAARFTRLSLRIHKWIDYIFITVTSSAFPSLILRRPRSFAATSRGEAKWPLTTSDVWESGYAFPKRKIYAVDTCQFSILRILLTNRVQGPYCKLRTEFFPYRFMAQARSAQAINRREKTRIRNLQCGPRERG